MTTTKTIKSTAAMFGAALTSIYAAPNLQADVVELTFSPTTVADSAFAAITLSTVGGDNLGPINIGNYSSLSIGFGAGFAGIGVFAQSALIAVGEDGTVSGLSAADVNFATSTRPANAIIGFQTDDGNLGFFTVDLPEGDTFTITGGLFGTEGEAFLAGVGEAPAAVPEPASGLALAALALGAVGVRRRRQVA